MLVERVYGSSLRVGGGRVTFYCRYEMNMQEMRGRAGENKAHIEHGSNTHTCSRRRFGFGRLLLA